MRIATFATAFLLIASAASAQSPSTPAATKLDPVSDQEDRIGHMPAAAQAALRRFQADGDAAEHEPVLMANLEAIVPRRPAVPRAEQRGDTQMIDALG